MVILNNKTKVKKFKIYYLIYFYTLEIKLRNRIKETDFDQYFSLRCINVFSRVIQL